MRPNLNKYNLTFDVLHVLYAVDASDVIAQPKRATFKRRRRQPGGSTGRATSSSVQLEKIVRVTVSPGQITKNRSVAERGKLHARYANGTTAAI